MGKLPTLIVGIGGIGCEIAATVFRMMKPEDRDVIGIVGIDTDMRKLGDYREMGMNIIRISDDKNVGDYLKERPEYKKWFPKNQFLLKRGMREGAGQVRALSRLAAISAESDGRFKTLDSVIDHIMMNRGNADVKTLTVMVVGSITGGTGAGMFIQLPLYIRKYAKTNLNINEVLIRGLFLGADITDQVAPGELNKKAVHVNDYTCIKELNAFYLGQTRKESEINFDIEYYDNKKSYPYDYLFLLQNGGEMGTHGNTDLKTIVQKAGEMVFFQLLTPIIGQSQSVEDNFVLSLISQAGMNRYGSVGLGRVIYPYKDIKEYTTLRWINDLIGSYWLMLDKEFYQQTREAAVQRRKDPYLVMPNKEDSYMSLFQEACGVKGKSNNCPLSFIKSEAFQSISGSEGAVDDKAHLFFENIQEYIKQAFDTETVRTNQRECLVNAETMKTLEGAQEEVNTRMNRYVSYKQLLQDIVNEKRMRILTEILPGSFESVERHSEELHNIYQLIGEVHPLAARYLLYSLKQKLREENENNDAILQNRSALDILETTDFISADDVKQNPQQALIYFQNLTGKAGAFGKLRHALKLGSVEDSKEYAEFKDLFETTMKKLVNDTESYYEAMLSKSVIDNLLSYLDVLTGLYENFFDTLENVVSDNKTKMQELMRRLEEDELGVLKICSDRDSLDRLYVKLETECIQDKAELLKSAKQAVFKELYKLFVKKRDKNAIFIRDDVRAHEREQEKRAVRRIFADSVLKEVRNQIDMDGRKVLDRNVKQMIFEECDMLYQLSPDRLSAKISDSTLSENRRRKEYLRYIVNRGLKLADPWIIDSNSSNRTISVYVGINDVLAVERDGTVDIAATQQEFLSNMDNGDGNRRTDIIIGGEFSPYEIVCYKARYVMAIEELTRYAEDSYNAKVYKERLRNIDTIPIGTGEDALQTVINPHLCSFWNQEAYIPALYSGERVQERRDCVRAFLYALVLDLCEKGRYEEDPEVITWLFTLRENMPAIMVENEPVESSYQGLYRSMAYNRSVKEALLERGGEVIAREKRRRRMETIERDILKHEIISDMTHNDLAEKEDNIIDVLASMREFMNQDEFTYLYKECIRFILDYCEEMLNGNRLMIRRVYSRIVDAIIENSVTAMQIAEKERRYADTGDDADMISIQEQGMKRVIEEFANTRYEKDEQEW